jgi:hypothetical protein
MTLLQERVPYMQIIKIVYTNIGQEMWSSKVRAF